MSLQHQADNIDHIIQENWFDKDKVRFFSESKSAYDGVKLKNGKIVRKRTEFTRMLLEIDSTSQPCIILVKDSSRLSRNELDSLEITKRLFWLYGNEIKIRQIIFANGISWDIKSDSRSIDRELQANYHYSVDTSNKVKATTLWKLKRGILNVKPPAWLSHWKNGGTIFWLKQNEKMPFIRKAFEMKMMGSNHNKIGKYLHSNGVKTPVRKLNEYLFSNEVFIWKGTHRDNRTGEVYVCDNLIFQEWKPPISMSLWQGAQANKGKKKNNYGWNQKLYPLTRREDWGNLLTTEKGTSFSGYPQKGYTNYKWNIYEGGKHTQINVSEKWILSEYMKFLKTRILEEMINKVVVNDTENDYFKKFTFHMFNCDPKAIDELKTSRYSDIKKVMLEAETDEITRDILHASYYKIADDDYDNLLNWILWSLENVRYVIPGIKTKKDLKIGRDFIIKNKEELIKSFALRAKKQAEIYVNSWLNFEKVVKDFTDGITLIFEESTKDVRTNNANLVAKLEVEKKKLIEEDKQAMRAFLRAWDIDGLREVLDEDREARKKQIKAIDEKIENLNNKEGFDLFCRQIPIILQKTFELSAKVLTSKENDVLKEDIIDLIKLTTFELKIKSKKALEIELYWPVKQVLFWEKCTWWPHGESNSNCRNENPVS